MKSVLPAAQLTATQPLLADFLRVAGVDEKNSRNADAIELVEAFILWTNEPLRQLGSIRFWRSGPNPNGIEILGKTCRKRYAKSDPKYLYRFAARWA